MRACTAKTNLHKMMCIHWHTPAITETTPLVGESWPIKIKLETAASPRSWLRMNANMGDPAFRSDISGNAQGFLMEILTLFGAECIVELTNLWLFPHPGTGLSLGTFSPWKRGCFFSHHFHPVALLRTGVLQGPRCWLKPMLPNLWIRRKW